MKATKQIDIYLTNKRNVRVIDVVQYDTGIQLVFTVKDFTIPSGVTATLYVQKPSGKFVYQEDGITVSGNTITVDLHNQAITEHGKVPYQVSVKSGSDVISTFTGVIMVEKSLKDAGATESKTVIRAFDEAVSDHVAEFQTKAEQIVAACIATIPDDYSTMEAKVNELANAVKGYLSGAVVFAADVSPVEHNPVVKVHGKNLIPYPYRNTTQTIGGVTFTDKGDGGVILNGTSTGGCNFFFTNYDFSVRKGKTYTFSLFGDFTATNKIDFWIYSNSLQEGFYVSSDSAKSKTFTPDKDFTEVAIYCVVGKETTVSGTLYPMLEEGDVANEYAPYVNPSAVTVKAYGKNLFPINEITLTKTNAWGLQQLGKVKLAPGKYTANCKFEQRGTDKSMVSLSVRDYNEATDTINSANSTETKGTLTVKFEVTQERQGIQICLYSNNTANVLNTECAFTNLQLECGEKATDFEAHKEPVAYVPNSDGTISDMTSLSPSMTILTDTEGVIVECEYNRDTNKVIDKLIDAINALGGKV